RRVFELDVLECPRCLGRMNIVAAIDPPDVIGEILDCMDMPSRRRLNRFFQRANDLPGRLRKPAFVAPQFLRGSGLPGALRSPKQTRTVLSLHRSGPPRTPPVLAFLPSTLP